MIIFCDAYSEKALQNGIYTQHKIIKQMENKTRQESSILLQ